MKASNFQISGGLKFSNRGTTQFTITEQDVEKLWNYLCLIKTRSFIPSFNDVLRPVKGVARGVPRQLEPTHH